jgi:hypothetical protein
MTIDVKELGQIQRFNGIDINQTKHYVKLHNKTYINKLISKHPWLQEENPLQHNPIPMKAEADYQKQLELNTVTTNEAIQKLEKEFQFGYRQAIGELIYAMTTCRCDISYAVIKLSQYSVKPHKIHFEAIQQIYRYLYNTKDKGIYYWRKTPRHDLECGPMPEPKQDQNYNERANETRQQHQHDLLVAAVDSNYAADIEHRRSVSGIILKIAGGTILYKTRYQPTVAHSSTEAEFTAAVDAGKYILYVRSILEEIGIAQTAATTLYEDNRGALLMANAQQPTKNTRHIEVRLFALQDWVEMDLIKLYQISTHDNYSDGMTKALARTLYNRHMNYIMGEIIPDYCIHLLNKDENTLTSTGECHKENTG